MDAYEFGKRAGIMINGVSAETPPFAQTGEELSRLGAAGQDALWSAAGGLEDKFQMAAEPFADDIQAADSWAANQLRKVGPARSPGEEALRTAQGFVDKHPLLAGAGLGLGAAGLGYGAYKMLAPREEEKQAAQFGKAAAAKVLASLSDQGPPNTMLKKLKGDDGKGEDLSPAPTGEGTHVSGVTSEKVAGFGAFIAGVVLAEKRAAASATGKLTPGPGSMKVKTVYRGTHKRKATPRKPAVEVPANV